MLKSEHHITVFIIDLQLTTLSNKISKQTDHLVTMVLLYSANYFGKIFQESVVKQINFQEFPDISPA